MRGHSCHVLRPFGALAPHGVVQEGRGPRFRADVGQHQGVGPPAFSIETLTDSMLRFANRDTSSNSETLTRLYTANSIQNLPL